MKENTDKSAEHNADNSAENKYFYITTTLPYVNAELHIGHALEFIQADVIARAKRLQGFEVFFNTGTDEHGLKIFRKAQEKNVSAQEYVDEYAARFAIYKDKLNLSYTNFIRTTDPAHIKAAQAFWKICQEKGDIYKDNYSVKYCVGCELEKTDTELENDRCPIHPNMDIEIIQEENYFFKYSKYQQALLDHYASNPDFVIPESRFNEIKSFVSMGLKDFSISRLKSKMPWGIEVPDDNEHVMYVWFDALVNYIATLGWPDTTESFAKYWPGTQIAGKDNLRQQSAMWQAMLLSAGLPTSKQIFIHGFINIGGNKISKSLGNIISPLDLVEEYGTDALRYYMTREVPSYEDSDFTMERFKEVYNANLANGIGNLTNRILKMSETHLGQFSTDEDTWNKFLNIPEKSIPQEFFDYLEKFEINKACDLVWNEISAMDAYIQDSQPFKLLKDTNSDDDKEKGRKIIHELVVRLYSVARMLNPILPETSDQIKNAIKANKMPATPLFLRKE